MTMIYVLAYDIGTTGVKTCLFRVDETISLIASASPHETERFGTGVLQVCT